ncbi:signal peptidase I [Microbacterium sp. SORGH_AS_0888]|uniref:signal peptidase I n=1 Tax=Microbacterium sp. SORGH_AS_0888 TaxID=3041791 RepID=UPI0027840029|nr:signal peptidase I [Microbacterium sp. SORGH_AS_0888]MDQ1129962.1 signal peptidase [Microbacterium sp. SORGH_AS_0888]
MSARRPRQTQRRLPLGLRVFGAVRSGILTLAAALGVVCIVVFAIALVTGIRPVVVISGSMEPTLPVGSVVFTRPAPAGDIRAGDIVTVERPRGLGLVTHRVVSTTAQGDGVYSYVLRGDANRVDDPEPYTVSTAGRYVFHVIWLGYVTLLLQSTQGLVMAGGLALVLIALFLLDPVRIARGGGDIPADAPFEPATTRRERRAGR